MPTPTGMLKKGDVLENISKGVTCRVVTRNSNDPGYSVYLNIIRGPKKGEVFLLMNAAFHLEHGWQLVIALKKKAWFCLTCYTRFMAFKVTLCPKCKGDVVQEDYP